MHDRKGGHLIWIAPSGGRDRQDSTTMKWKPAMFETSAVENIRRLTEHSKAPGHMYPLALLCYDVMPPPTQVEKEIGEKRLIGFTGVGLSVGPEMHYKDITLGCSSSEEAAESFAEAAWQLVNKQYSVLSRAVENREGIAASTDLVALSQPWYVSSSVSMQEPKIPCHSS
ncbi:hypothetical protein L7F22_064535 [Adiantum nelumboides]|nr:hypothetical protein [Adiantum nelumboides]